MVGTVAAAIPRTAQAGQFMRLFVCAALCVVAAELIGPASLPLGGHASVALLPFLWALLLGTAWGLASPHLPQAVGVDTSVQALSAAVLQPALLLFIAKLGLLVGGVVPKLVASGWALAFQELGHFFGTAVIGLPLALLLGIKREAIGATFSVGREPSLAIIGERYGMASPEGHGVLAEYLTGIVFGTVFIAIFASLVASLHWFDPLALAMGAGMGSGSLMAAASGAIAAQQSPDMAKQVAAFAAASNLITTTVGTYFTLLLSLPFTVWAYKVLEPVLGRLRAPSAATRTVQGELDNAAPFVLSAPWFAAIWLGTGMIALVSNDIAFGTTPDGSAVTGMAIIAAVAAVGFVLYRLTKGFVPAVFWASILAMALTYPGTPYAAQMAALTGKVNFLALATPVIALAGLSIAKDMPVFRKLGWRIVVVSLAANAGTFLGGSFVAQLFLRASPG